MTAVVEAEVAFAGDGHAQRPMGKHLKSDEFPRRTGYVLVLNGFRNPFDLVQVQFPGKDHHIREARPEPQCLDVRDVELGRRMDFKTDFPAV